MQAGFHSIVNAFGIGTGLVRAAALGTMVLGLVAGPAAAAGEAMGIVGQDNRVIIDAEDRRWHAVGRLNRETGGFCTAVLIAPKEALTAAHCLWDQRRRHWVDPQSLHFVPGYRRGTYLGHARVARYRLAEGISIDERGHPESLLDDWAVLELTLDLEAGAGIEPMLLIDGAQRPELVGQTIASGGYNRDRPHLPEKVQPCQALGIIESGRLLLHDCDSRAGSSGSPIVVERDGRLVVVGIQSAVVSAGGETLALAVLMQRAMPATILLSQ